MERKPKHKHIRLKHEEQEKIKRENESERERAMEILHTQQRTLHHNGFFMFKCNTIFITVLTLFSCWFRVSLCSRLCFSVCSTSLRCVCSTTWIESVTIKLWCGVAGGSTLLPWGTHPCPTFTTKINSWIVLISRKKWNKERNGTKTFHSKKPSCSYSWECRPCFQFQEEAAVNQGFCLNRKASNDKMFSLKARDWIRSTTLCHGLGFNKDGLCFC